MTTPEHNDRRRAALLVIDVQGDFLSPVLGSLRDGYEDRLAELLTTIRATDVAVVHVHSRFSPDGSDWMPRYRRRGLIPCVDGTPGAEVAEAALPAEGEEVLVKQTFDAFLGTGLEATLAASGIQRVLVAGLVTSTCVLFSAASAMQRGFDVAVVEDAVADEPMTHVAVLDRYRFVFDVVSRAEAVGWANR